MASFAYFNLLPATVLYVLVSLNLRIQASAACYTSNMNAYWVPIEGREDMSHTGLPLSLTGPKTRPLVDSDGAVIAYVAEPTFQKCKEEGICYLQKDDQGNSRLVNYVGGEDVFRLLNLFEFPFGLGGWNNQVEIYVSVASSDYAPGTKLYVKELDGFDLGRAPEEGYFRTHHNGCVRVDDVAPAACSINFFLGFFTDFKRLRARFPVQVHVEPRGNCEMLFYLQVNNQS